VVVVDELAVAVWAREVAVETAAVVEAVDAITHATRTPTTSISQNPIVISRPLSGRSLEQCVITSCNREKTAGAAVAAETRIIAQP
jgi:hypothetical protein